MYVDCGTHYSIAQRPSLRDVLEHPFFTASLVPPSIPSSAHDIVPAWRNLSVANSRQNLQNLREAALLGEQPQSDEEGPDSAQAVKSSSPALERTSAAQQEREFQNAVQPGSPISILLNSAKQPLVVAPRDSENLIKRLTASRERNSTDLLAKRAVSGLKGIQEEKEREKDKVTFIKKDYGRKTAVENQKARIVAQMTATLPSASPVLTEDEGKEKDLKRSSTIQASSSGSRHVAGSSGSFGRFRLKDGIDFSIRTQKFGRCCRSCAQTQCI